MKPETQQFIIQMLGVLAVLIPAILGAIKSFKAASNTETAKADNVNLNAQMDAFRVWQASQDDKLLAIQKDNARAFQEAGQHRNKQDLDFALLKERVDSTQRRLERIPTGTETNYRRMEESQRLPTVAPLIPSVEEK